MKSNYLLRSLLYRTQLPYLSSKLPLLEVAYPMQLSRLLDNERCNIKIRCNVS